MTLFTVAYVPVRRLPAHRWARRAGLAVLLAAIPALGHAGQPAQARQQIAAVAGDEFLLVDCLLPGQVRQLGRNMTYVSRRRPIRTTPRDCEIRGGEYVAHDRASYATALKVWLPRAKAGDPKAQTYVGEIFEKGLGLPPDYGAAAQWYRRAADQGYSPAQIDLGQLYEKGLGVAKDPQAAIGWYRKASGLAAAGLQYVPSAAVGAEIRDLRAEVARRTKETKQLKGEIGQLRRRLEDSLKELERRKHDAKDQRSQLLDAQRQLAARRDTLDDQRRQLAAERKRAEGLQHEYARREQALADAARSADAATQATENAKVEELKGKLAKLQGTLKRREDTISKLSTGLSARERDLKKKNKEYARLESELRRLNKNANAQRTKLAHLRKREMVASAEPPKIELIDPKVPPTRGGTPVIMTRGNIKTRVVVGRVVAPAGVVSLLLNDQEQKFNAQGVFRAGIPVLKDGTNVSIVAVDANGTRSEMMFIIKPKGVSGRPSVTVATEFNTKVRGIHFGRYHALVIGNDMYKFLPHLETAVGDAKAVANVLKERYGFQVTLLLNATRYDILSAMNKLRENLKPDDNLLIYYAGHGELDKVNHRGHWLPVDAERDSSANWISNVSITDILNAMSAKEVMVVADSCYSGALTRAGMAKLSAGMSDDQRLAWIRALAKQRARVALTSGGLKPVMDSGGGKHSVFAKAFIEVLKRNHSVMEARRVFEQVSQEVTNIAGSYQFDQVPEYAPISHAGHGGGEFFFVAERKS